MELAGCPDFRILVEQRLANAAVAVNNKTDIGMTLKRERGPGYHNRGAVVPAHRIQCNPDNIRHSDLQSFHLSGHAYALMQINPDARHPDPAGAGTIDEATPVATINFGESNTDFTLLSIF